MDNPSTVPSSSHDRNMMLRKASGDDLWLSVATGQHGLISRGQLLGLGMTPSQARTNVTNGRWQRVYPGVYATFTGALDPTQRVWAALLYAGQDAVACCATSLWLFGVLDQAPDPVHVSIPESRRVDPLHGVRPHRRRVLDRLETPIHPAASPPRIRIEESLLDASIARSEADAVGLILRATQRRLTTAARISAALSRRAVQPRRALIGDVLADVEAGVASPLERQYRRRVEAPHGLPIGTRNLAEVDDQETPQIPRRRVPALASGGRARRRRSASPRRGLPRPAPGQPGNSDRPSGAPLRLARRSRRALCSRRTGRCGAEAARLARCDQPLRTELPDSAWPVVMTKDRPETPQN